MKSVKNGRTTIPGLDGLRAIALIFIFLFHLMPGTFKGGFLGTEMFFVLTGFLLADSQPLRSAGDAFHFYVRKVHRLFPQTMICVLFMCGMLRLFDPAAAYGLREQVLSIFGGWFNVYQIRQAQDYFQAFSAGSPFTHLWMLAVDIQCYMIWPALSFISQRLLRRDRESAIFMMMICAGALSFIMPICYLTTSNVTFIYYGTFTRIAAVCIGIAAGTLYQMGNPAGRLIRGVMKEHPLLRILLPYGSLLLAVFLLLHADGKSAWIYCGGMAAVDLWCAAAVMTAAEGKWGCGILELPFLKKLSRMGFELYLWQYPVIYLLNHLLGESVPVKLLETAVTVLLAIWSRAFQHTVSGILRNLSRTVRRKSSRRKQDIRISRLYQAERRAGS